MIYRSISYVPALYKIFDEILLDAAENKQRDPSSMDSLKVSIDPLTNTISVHYNGIGIPVVTHQETGVYVPELIYGNLNYNDGGRYGHGTKLTNIFSTEFVIETADGCKKYKQVFTKGMSNKYAPELTECKAGENWTKVTFKPDLKAFKMNSLEEDIVGLMKKRVLDMAGFLGKTVNVELNDQLIRIIISCKDLYMEFAEKSKPAIELAFRKKKAKDTETWIRKLKPGNFIVPTEKCIDKLINYRHFFNKETRLFSRADLQRSIPSMVDGLKLVQRKVLFCSFKKKLCIAINVQEFIGYVSEHSAYHHGEQSLASTLIGMAQDFVGSNNINLLKPIGQFGTRNMGGKDHASARHINTELNPITRCLFHENDDKLLDYLNEDGRSIEPNWYIPIIPLVLVNGSSERIGTSWSSYIPNYNPRKIIANVKHWLNGENMVPMQPWYRGFEGKIEKSSKKGEYIVSGTVGEVEGNGENMVPMQPWYRGFKGKIEKSSKKGAYIVSGTVGEVDGMTFKITELPIRKWTQDYKRYLECVTEDFSQQGDCANVNITIRLKSDKKDSKEDSKEDSITKEELLKKFKLTSTISTSNMYLLDAEGNIKKFDNPEQILEEFIPLRLKYYEKRREYILANLKRLLFVLYNIVKFILGVLNEKINLNLKRADLLMELKREGFTPMPRKGKSTSTEPQVAGASDDNSEALKDDYEYLLSLPFGFFVVEGAQKLLAEMNEKKKQFDVLKTTTAKSLWMKDLNELEKKLDEIYGKEEEEESERSSQAGNAVKVSKPKGRASSKKIQKDFADYILSRQEFQEFLDAYNFKPSGEKTGALETEEPPLPADDDIIPFQELLDAYNFKPSGEKTGALETEEPPLPAGKKQNNREGPAPEAWKLDPCSQPKEQEAWKLDPCSQPKEETEEPPLPAGKKQNNREGGAKKKTTLLLDIDSENEVSDTLQQPAPKAWKLNPCSQPKEQEANVTPQFSSMSFLLMCVFVI